MADYYDIILKFELALPFFLLSLYLSIVVLGRKKQDKKSLQKLISLYKEKEDGRKKTVIEFLKNKVGLDEPASEETSKKILQARKSFIQKLISAFLTRKEESIANLDNELSMITRSYQELSISVTKEEVTEEAEDELEEKNTAEEPAKADPKAAEDLVRLKKENKNLKIEVHTTLSTLNNIFAEYTSMFGEESDRKDMSVDEILTAMESFGADQIEAASSTDASAEDLMTEPKSEAKEEAKPEVKEEEPVAEAEPSWDEAFEEAEAEPEPKAETKREIKEEPAAEAEPSWDEAFEEAEAEPKAEAKPEIKEEEPAAEAEPSWDEAFEEAEAEPKAEAKPEIKEEEPAAEAEPSWDEAFEEAEAEPKAEAKDAVDKNDASNESDDGSDDGWGDDNDDIDELDDEDMDDIQPEWGNAMEEEIQDPDDEEEKK